MSGRHGKLSGSPFHVITIKNLAGEKYGDHFSSNIPFCKYRLRTSVCNLPQNKKRYGRNCIPSYCLYLSNDKKIKRKSCAFLVEDKCTRGFSNCTENEDLAYCCEYYLNIDENRKINDQLKKNVKYHDLHIQLSNSVTTLLKKGSIF